MNERLRELRGQLSDARRRAEEIIKAGGDDLDLNEQQVHDLRAINDEMDALAPQIRDLEGLEAIRDRVVALGEVAPRQPIHPVGNDSNGRPAPGREARTLGEMIVASDAFRNYQRGAMAGPVSSLDVDIKAVLFQTTAGWAPESVRTGFVTPFPTRPAPHVVDFIPELTTQQAAVKYMEETTFTNAAAETAEAAIFPEAALVLTEKSQTVRKVSVWLPVTDEQLEDEAEARDYIDNRLTFMLAQRVDLQVLVGDGVAPNLLGTESVTGIQTQALGTDPIFDAGLKLFTKIRDDGFAEPSVAFIRPAKYETIALTRTAEGVYIYGHPSTGGPQTLWGVPLVQTTVVTATKIVAGDYTQHSGLYVRRGVDVQVGYQSDDFIKGRLAVRADVRLAMVHYRPKAFGNVTGL